MRQRPRDPVEMDSAVGEVGSSLFEAGKSFFLPSPNDQVRGARRRGQGTETLAELSGLPLSRACVSQRLDA